jgi:hypothetical protein
MRDILDSGGGFVRLKLAFLAGLGILMVGLAACGDAQRSTYVRYMPPINYSSPTPSPT